MVEEARLESVCAPKVHRGFESRSFRKARLGQGLFEKCQATATRTQHFFYQKNMAKKSKKAKTKRKASKKKSSKNALIKDKSIVWAVIFGVVLAIGLIWYLIS